MITQSVFIEISMEQNLAELKYFASKNIKLFLKARMSASKRTFFKITKLKTYIKRLAGMPHLKSPQRISNLTLFDQNY